MPLIVNLSSLAAIIAVIWNLAPVLTLIAIAAASLQAFTVLLLARTTEAARYVQFKSQAAASAIAEQALTKGASPLGREPKPSLSKQRQFSIRPLGSQ